MAKYCSKVTHVCSHRAGWAMACDNSVLESRSAESERSETTIAIVHSIARGAKDEMATGVTHAM